MKMPEVRIEEVRRFLEESLTSVGTPNTEAKAHAALLLHADLTGHFSHGLNRLPFYITDIEAASTDPLAKPVVLKESAATAWVDGCNALGATVGHFCMNVAMRKAKEAGVGWVSVKRSNHFGMAGYWAKLAESEGFIGMAFTNSSPIMVPTRAKDGAMGTNPVALYAPAGDGDDHLLVDMASTAVALGKVEVQIHKGEQIPEGWALDPDGNPTTDSHVAFNSGRLLPLGGVEETSGYKGYALSSLVETFCGGLSGSKCAYQVRSWSHDVQLDPPDLGQCFVAIDPGCFAPGFAERMAACLQHLRGMEPVEPSLPVLVPGDKERLSAERTTCRGTIAYPQGQIDTCLKLADKLGVAPMEIV